jgi:flavin reductase (DIM6/NTAB) family NADH-FMN oxidoreductase RutF
MAVIASHPGRRVPFTRHTQADTTMIEIDTTTLGARDASLLMTGLIVPRPIAWVSTIDGRGRANLAPHSYFNAVSSSPPILMFSSSHTSRFNADGRKDTLRNVEATAEFVVNIVSEDLLEAMNRTSAEVPPDVDEFILAGVTKHPSARIGPPRVGEAKVSLECRLNSLVEVGDATVIFGDVLLAHIDEGVWRNGRVDAEALRPMSRLGGSLYAALGSIQRITRPSPPSKE